MLLDSCFFLLSTLGQVANIPKEVSDHNLGFLNVYQSIPTTTLLNHSPSLMFSFLRTCEDVGISMCEQGLESISALLLIAQNKILPQLKLIYHSLPAHSLSLC